MASDEPQRNPLRQCSFCHTFQDTARTLARHEARCMSRPVLQNAAGQAESPCNALDDRVAIPRRMRSVRPAVHNRGWMKQVVPNQYGNNLAFGHDQGGNNDEPQIQPGKATSSDDEPVHDNPDDEQDAKEPAELEKTCSDKRSSSMECYGGHPDLTDHDPVVMQQQNLEIRTTLPDLNFPDPIETSYQKALTVSRMDQANVVPLLKPHSEKNSASVDNYGGGEKSGNEAPSAEKKMELSQYQCVASCHEDSSVTEQKRRKLSLSVPASVEEQKDKPEKFDLNLPALFDNSDDATQSDTGGQMQQRTVATFPRKSSNDVPIEVEGAQFGASDHHLNLTREQHVEAPNNSIVLQGNNRKFDLNIPAPFDNSDEAKHSDTGGQMQKRAAATFPSKSSNEVPVEVKEPQLSTSDHQLSLARERNLELEVKPKVPDLNHSPSRVEEVQPKVPDLNHSPSRMEEVQLSASDRQLSLTRAKSDA